MALRILFAPLVYLLLFISFAHAGSNDTGTVVLRHWVTDQTGTLDDEDIRSIDKMLSDFQKETSNQIVVLMVPTLGDRSLEEYALAEAERNKVGKKDRNNGILIFIAKNDRRIRFEVGYGLEGALTDALSSQIILHEIAPRFRTGDFAGGIKAGVTAIMQVTKGEYEGEEENDSRKKVSGILVFLLFLVVFGFLRIFRGGRRHFLGSGGYFSGGPFWGGGGFGGGFGGGSGGGGFSGGGGSFGGGGASGGW